MTPYLVYLQWSYLVWSYRGEDTADCLAAYTSEFRHILLLAHHVLGWTNILIDRHDIKVNRTTRQDSQPEERVSRVRPFLISHPFLSLYWHYHNWSCYLAFKPSYLSRFGSVRSFLNCTNHVPRENHTFFVSRRAGMDKSCLLMSSLWSN